jgi:hypothetical protein
MQFFLGTHQPAWLGRTSVPLFVSRRRLTGRKALPRAAGPWALDSGGFSELSLHGGWTVTPRAYAAEVRRFAAEIGGLQWAAPQDWMCEPVMLAKTGRSVAAHQRLTVRNYLDLREIAPDLPWVPVLQGWEPDDYRHCVDLYAAAGVDLAALPLVGLGSVCRRQHTRTAARVVERLQPLRLHAFGFKLTGLAAVAPLLASADSMAWSLAARRRPALPGCSHRNCANCLRYALEWQRRVLALLARPQQLSFGFEEALYA